MADADEFRRFDDGESNEADAPASPSPKAKVKFASRILLTASGPERTNLVEKAIGRKELSHRRAALNKETRPSSTSPVQMPQLYSPRPTLESSLAMSGGGVVIIAITAAARRRASRGRPFRPRSTRM